MCNKTNRYQKRIALALGLSTIFCLNLASCSSQKEGNSTATAIVYQESDIFTLNESGEISGFKELVELEDNTLEISHPDSNVTKIAAYAFGTSASNAQVQVFEDESGLVEAEIDDSSERNTNPLNEIESEPFTIIIDEGLKTIGENAFSFNDNIMSFQLSDGLEVIEDRAFMGTKASFSELPTTLTTIGDAAFNGCNISGNLVIPALVTVIGRAAFSSTNIQTLNFTGTSIEVIESEAFTSNFNLVTISLPSGLKEIGKMAFANNLGLKNVTLSDTLEVIGEGAFDNCMLIEELILPDSLTTIKDKAFNMCTNLSSIRIPGNVTELGEEIFMNTSNLKTIVFEDGITSLDFSKVLYGCTVLEYLEIPSTVTEISNQFFGYSSSFDSLKEVICYSEHLELSDFPEYIRDKVVFK